MKTNRNFTLTPAFLAVLAALGLSACGKNMNLALKDGLKKNGAGASVGSDVDGNIKENTTQNKDVYPHYDGTLEPYSKFDLSDPALAKSAYPYLNLVKGSDGTLVPAPVQHIGKDGEGEAGYITRSNLVFRAIKHVPKKELIQSVAAFGLELKGVVLHNPKGTTRAELTKQLLCLLANPEAKQAGIHACTGMKADETADEKANLNAEFWKGDDKNPNLISKLFSDLKLEKNESLSKDASKELGSIQSTAAETIKIDLLDAFQLKCEADAKEEAQKKCLEKQLAFIENYSTEFNKVGHRKFRFVVANEVYIHSGKLDLQFNLVKDSKGKTVDSGEVKNPNAEDVIKGADDLVDGSTLSAVAADADGAGSTTPTATATATPTPTPNATDETKSDGAPTSQVDGVVNGAGNTEGDPTLMKNQANQNEPQIEKVEVSQKPVATEVKPIVIPAPIVIVIEQPKKDPQKADIVLDLFDLVLRFKKNDAKLTKRDDVSKLIETARALSQIGDALDRVTVIGHASKTGSDEYNRALSKKRANTVVMELVKKGKLNSKKVATPIGAGEPKISSCAPIQECARDRRVEIKITLNKKDPVNAKNIRDRLVEALSDIWESNTQLAPQDKE